MTQAELVGDVIHVTSTYNERHLIQQVPGSRFDSDLKLWRVPLGWPSCVMLRELFKGSLVLGPVLTGWAWTERKTRLDPAAALRDVLSLTAFGDQLPNVDELTAILDALVHIEADAKLRLYDYQVVDLAFVVTNRRCVLGNEPGLGKTGVVLRALQVMQRLGMDPFPAVITCPNSLKRTVWAKEAAAWAPEFRVSVVDGGVAGRRKALAAEADIYVLNWESLRLHTRLAPYGDTELTDTETHPKELNDMAVRTFIADEAHKVKDPRAKQSRAAWAVAQHATYRIAMTGTPVANHIGDLWSLLKMVEPTWFPAKTKFMDRYAMTTPSFYGGTTVVGIRPDTRDELFRVIDPLIRRVPKSLALPQLPEKLPTQYRETPMGTKQAKAYRQMEELMIAQLLSGELLAAPNPLAKLTRLSQFAASMADFNEAGEVKLAAPSNKVDDLVDLLEELGEKPLVVAAVSRQLIEIAAERLKKEDISHGLITGAQTTVERLRAVERFQAGQDRVILLTLGAGAEGITLTRADTMLFMQRSYSVIQNKQAEDRVHRIGSEIHQCISIIEQVTPGTVEERRIEVLQGKEDRIQEVIRDQQVIERLLGMKVKATK